MSFGTDRIRAFNDDLRRHLIGGGAVMTPGVAALGQEFVERAVKTFDDFHHANDPHQKHDFGIFDLDGCPAIPAAVDEHLPLLATDPAALVWRLR